MQPPVVTDPHRYRGLYVFDFGTWTALGYTVEEVATLLESEQYRDGKVYRIVRIAPDGQMELQGVSAATFQRETGLLFNRETLDAARADFAALCQLGEAGAPCRAYVHLADRGPSAVGARYVTALIYPAEYDADVSHWLLSAAYAGGDTVEGGPSHVSDYYTHAGEILERRQLWSRPAIPARSADELFASVRRAVQR